MYRLVTIKKFPELFECFFGVSTLKGVPGRPADAGVGAVEGLRHHAQHLTFVRRL
jgi:hypothetical protein